MTIRFERPLSVESYVADTVYRLPTAAASLVAARSDLAVPFGSEAGIASFMAGSEKGVHHAPPWPRSAALFIGRCDRGGANERSSVPDPAV
jgi:hypothetical protein